MRQHALMRWLFLPCLRALPVVLLVACAQQHDATPRRVPAADEGGQETGESRSPSRSTSTTTTRPERDEFVVGDRVETGLGNFVQVFSYEQPVPPADEFWTPEPGFEFAVIDVEGCAGPTDDTSGLRAMNPFDFELQMPDNTRIQADVAVREPALNHVGLPLAGDCARGFVTYQVPQGLRPVLIEDTVTDPVVRWTVPG